MRLYFAIPGDLNLPTGGYGYDRRLIMGLRELGWTVDHVKLPGTFPFPDAATLLETDNTFAVIPDGSLVLIDGLAYGAMPEIAARHADRLTQVALVHHPLCDETGLLADVQQKLFASEKAALASSRGIFCTSRTTAQRLAEGFISSPTKCVVAEPGTDPSSRRAAAPSNTPLILAVGSLVRRKGHDVLIDALGMIANRRWTARIVGADDRDAETTAKLRSQIGKLELCDRITLTGGVKDVRAELEKAQIFALASRHEGYGMAFAEALAHGLPIVACNAGAVPDLVPQSAGTLVPPDDPAAVASALAQLLDNDVFWQKTANAAWAVGQNLPNWTDTAQIVSTHLKEIKNGV